MIQRSVAFCLVAAFLSACAFYTLVPAGTIKVDGAFTVDTPIAWSRQSETHAEQWTTDGFQLQMVEFVSGLEDGEAIYNPPSAKSGPVYDASMSLPEIVELVFDTWELRGAANLRADPVVPATLGGVDGFRVEYTYTLEDGLERRGVTVGAVREEKLYLLSYVGTAAHYYEKNLDAFENMVKTLAFI